MKVLGSPQLLYALQQSHGLASWTTVQCHAKIPKLMLSIEVPSSDEIIYNVTSFYDLTVKPPAETTQTGLLSGNVAMFDGIVLDTRC